MCGRIALYTPPERLARRFDADLSDNLGDAATPHWNVPPTQTVLALVDRKPDPDASAHVEKEEHQRLLAGFKWGLIPWWAKDLSIGNKQFNARAESLDRKPAFRSALERHRCLVIADGFYEWRKPADDKLKKTPFFFTRSDSEPLAFAGLWETWRDPSLPKEEAPRIVSCTIVTTSAGPDVESIHDRMPVIVERADFDTWLERSPLDPKVRARILSSAPSGTLASSQVSSSVNSVKNDGPELVDSVS